VCLQWQVGGPAITDLHGWPAIFHPTLISDKVPLWNLVPY